MSQAELLSRLESVTSRLEKLASQGFKGGSGGGGGDDNEIPPFVGAYQAIMDNQVKNLIKTITDLGIPDAAQWVQQGFDNINNLMKAVALCKKPSDQDLMGFLKPGVEAIQASDNARVKGKDTKTWGDHYKTVYEIVNSISWVTMHVPMGTPKSHVEAQEQATDFNGNRVIKNNKDDKTKKWIEALKALNKAQKDFVCEYFKTELNWNPKGGDLKSFDPKNAKVASSSSSSSVSATPSKATSSSSAKVEKEEEKGGDASMGNIGAVFGELSKGLAVTSGLKKVTDDQKTKNRKDRTGHVEIKEAPKKAKKEKPASKTEYVGGRWLVANYNEGLQVVDKADMKSNVYITNCDDTTVQIKQKVKSITIDSCCQCRFYIDEVVSSVEVVNCKSVTLYINTKAPSISIEKSQSPRIVLTRSAYNANPDIYTSNISAMNIEIPGAKDTDDNIELPVPEQFLTKLDCKTGKATTTQVTHGG
jgi:adenylyl cyclase-associated protein